MRGKTALNNTGTKWLYVILGIIMFICLGTVYSWSVFRTPFEELYKLNATQSGMPYLVFLVFYTFFMMVSGRFVDRHNPGAMAVLGGLLVGAGWLASGLVKNFYAVVFFYGMVSGSGVGIAYGVPIKVVSGQFTKKKGLALGLLLSGFGLSPFVTAPVIKLLLNHFGVNQTFVVFGAAFGILTPMLGLFFRQAGGAAQKDKNTVSKSNLSSIIKKREFIGLWSCFAIGAAVGLMVIGVTGQIGTELFGLSSQTAALFISVFAVFNALGRPFFGHLTDKIGVRRTASVSFLIIIAASLLMLMPKLHSTAIYIIALALLWMNLGAWLSIAPTATGRLFGQENYSRNYGILFSAYGAGALMGTPAAGLLRTIMGSYMYIFIPAAALCLIGLVLANSLLSTGKIKKEPDATA